MIGSLVLGLLADVVFGWASASGRSFRADLGAYMERQGLVPREDPTKPTSR
jgi:hypothetical protein